QRSREHLTPCSQPSNPVRISIRRNATQFPQRCDVHNRSARRFIAQSRIKIRTTGQHLSWVCRERVHGFVEGSWPEIHEFQSNQRGSPKWLILIRNCGFVQQVSRVEIATATRLSRWKLVARL